MAEAKNLRGPLERPTSNDLGCRWYVAAAGRTEGPFTYEGLVERARAGDMGRSDHVWRPGFEQWIAVSARPDLLAVFPDRPALGLVPPDLEAARSSETEDLRFSRDVVHEEVLGGTMDLPTFAGATSIEDEALEALQRSRADGPPPAELLADGLSLDQGAELEGSDLSALARLADLDSEAASTDVSLDPDDMARVMGRGRLRRMALVGLLIAMMGGLGVLAWRVEQTRPIPPGTPEPARGPAEPPIPAEVPKVRHAGVRAAPIEISSRGDAPAVRQTVSVAAAASAETPLAWLNRKRSAPVEPAPEPAPRAAPRNFKVAREAASTAEVELEGPVALPERLSQDQVGQVVSARLSTFARCGRFDRAAQVLPPGSSLLLWLRSQGRVRKAKAEGVEGEVASCLKRVARQLRFPAFSGEGMKIGIEFSRGGAVRAQVVD